MDDPQAKVRLECIKVAIVMKQLMVRFNAEGCDEAVDRSTNCNAPIAKRAVVNRRRTSDRRAVSKPSPTACSRMKGPGFLR